MKRELKDRNGGAKQVSLFPCFTHHPDEEGTESLIPPAPGELYQVASHTIPMKRELKGHETVLPPCAAFGFTHHPDEEGTERQPTTR